MAYIRRQHRREHALHRHNMATGVPGMKKATIARPAFAIESHKVIIDAAELDIKLPDQGAFRFLGVSLGFLDFVDHV